MTRLATTIHRYLDRNFTQYGPESSIRKTDLFHIVYYPQVYNWMVCGPQRYYANLYEQVYYYTRFVAVSIRRLCNICQTQKPLSFCLL